MIEVQLETPILGLWKNHQETHPFFPLHFMDHLLSQPSLDVPHRHPNKPVKRQLSTRNQLRALFTYLNGWSRSGGEWEKLRGDFMVELYDTGHSPHGSFRGEICTGNIEEMLKKSTFTLTRSKDAIIHEKMFAQSPRAINESTHLCVSGPLSILWFSSYIFHPSFHQSSRHNNLSWMQLINWIYVYSLWMSCENPSKAPSTWAIKFDCKKKVTSEIQEAEIPLWHVMKNSCQGDTPPVAPGAAIDAIQLFHGFLWKKNDLSNMLSIKFNIGPFVWNLPSSLGPCFSCWIYLVCHHAVHHEASLKSFRLVAIGSSIRSCSFFSTACTFCSKDSVRLFGIKVFLINLSFTTQDTKMYLNNLCKKSNQIHAMDCSYLLCVCVEKVDRQFPPLEEDCYLKSVQLQLSHRFCHLKMDFWSNPDPRMRTSNAVQWVLYQPMIYFSQGYIYI